jgi:RNA polymerase sigma-70 factor (ECF subfamily)
MQKPNTHEGPLVAFALTHVGRWVRSCGIPEADREDVAQEVLIKVIRNAHTYDAARPIRPWVGKIAFRTARDHRRSLGRRREVPLELDGEPGAAPLAVAEEGASGDPAERLSSERVQALVAQALDALPPGRRHVLVRVVRDGAPMAEIAAELGISIDAGYLRLSRARAQFRTVWARLTDEPIPVRAAGPAPPRGCPRGSPGARPAH